MYRKFDASELDDILHYSLIGLLKDTEILAIYKPASLVILMGMDENYKKPILHEANNLTLAEISLLLPLLENYPYFVPYENLLASLDTNNTYTDIDVDHARIKLEEAQEDGYWDQEIRPVRNALSRLRLKIKRFNIDIGSIFETGYQLQTISAKKRKTNEIL